MKDLFELEYIYNSDSKKIFKEIITNYYHENYRICIVSLQTLFFYDTIKKLEELNDIYNDKRAKEIIEKIKTMQKDETSYSELENNILSLCKDNNFFDEIFIEKIYNLRKIRNRCAHPAFYQDCIYVPTKHEVLLYIEFLYVQLLTKHFTAYSDVVQIITKDIQEMYESDKYDTTDLKNKSHLSGRVKKIYNRYGIESKQKLFNTLFDLAIIKKNADVDKYRRYTMYYLLWLIDTMKEKNEIINYEILKKLDIIHLDEKYYENELPYIYHIIINDYISLNNIQSVNQDFYKLVKEEMLKSEKLYSFYEKVFNSTEEFFRYITENNVNIKQIKYVLDNNIDDTVDQKYMYNMVKIIIESIPTYNGFDSANIYIEYFINNFKKLTIEQCNEILLIIQNNYQIANSSRSGWSSEKQRIAELYGLDSYEEVKKKYIYEIID